MRRISDLFGGQKIGNQCERSVRMLPVTEITLAALMRRRNVNTTWCVGPYLIQCWYRRCYITAKRSLLQKNNEIKTIVWWCNLFVWCADSIKLPSWAKYLSEWQILARMSHWEWRRCRWMSSGGLGTSRDKKDQQRRSREEASLFVSDICFRSYVKCCFLILNWLP